jgi:putative aldouronate transport system substrate-binding protein
MMKNKTFLFLQAFLLPAFLFAGGSQAAKTAQPVSDPALYNPPGTYPIVNQKITLSAFAPGQSDNNLYEDNLYTKELEEKTGIHLTWRYTPLSGYKEKLTLMFASDDLTDIIMSGAVMANRLDKPTEAFYGSQGLIIDLSKYYDTVSVGYKQGFPDFPGLREFITAPDGKIYDLPFVSGSLHTQYNLKCWINIKWLKDLGLKMPTTTEEYYNVLKTFKEKDANGNGSLNDEIPLSTTKSGAGTQIDGFLMAPFQLTPETDKLYLDNGKVVFSPVTDSYREGLRYLNRLYREGLLNPESFTQDSNNQVNKNESGPVPVIGSFLAQRPGYANNLTTVPNSKRWEQYDSVPPLKGPGGKVTAAWNPYIQYATGQTFITKNCKYPEAAFRLVDLCAEHEMGIRMYYGIEGTDWVKPGPNELGIDGLPAEVKKVPGVSRQNVGWGQLSGLVLKRHVEMIAINQNPFADDVLPLDGRHILLYKGALTHQAVRQSLESVLPSLFAETGEVAELALLKTNVMDYSNEAIVRFVTGDLNIDKDWDVYKTRLAEIGLPRYLEILQNDYDKSAFSKGIKIK